MNYKYMALLSIMLCSRCAHSMQEPARKAPRKANQQSVRSFGSILDKEFKRILQSLPIPPQKLILYQKKPIRIQSPKPSYGENKVPDYPDKLYAPDKLYVPTKLYAPTKEVKNFLQQFDK